MSIFRVEKNKNFTVMSNYHLKDTSLSLKAKGLLSLMLSLPDNWDYTVKGLSTICKDGIDSIKSTVKELETNGYIIRARVRNEKGHLTSTEYTIYEEPKRLNVEKETNEPSNNNSTSHKSDEVKKQNNSIHIPKRDFPTLDNRNKKTPKGENPLLDEPMVENPNLEKPMVEKHTQLSTNILNTKLLNINISTPNQSITDEKSNTIDRYDYREYIELIKKNIEYPLLCQQYDNNELYELVEIMSEVLCSYANEIKISGEAYPTELVKSRFMKINSSHIEYIMNCLKNNHTKVKNIKTYLRACLFNAPITIDNYYKTLVNYDTCGK